MPISNSKIKMHISIENFNEYQDIILSLSSRCKTHAMGVTTWTTPNCLTFLAISCTASTIREVKTP